MSTRAHSLFEVWGIEIEYMIVDADSLDVSPIADEVLRAASGQEEWVEDLDRGDVGWSNELVSHVLELKNVVPSPDLDSLVPAFTASLQELGKVASERGARLMPSAMHPWMQPRSETRIWPHESGPIYNAYHELFDCHRHGWANLQSVHLNLPFADEDEFGRLMAAVRIVLPLIPALAASSPIFEGRATGRLDNRLDAYRTNSARVPSMTGDVVPEPIFGIEEYRERILAPINRDLRQIGAPEVLLGREFANARGAIARFDRMAIEVRLIDAQECPIADLAICAAVGGAIRFLVEERGAPLEAQCAWPSASLVTLLDRCIGSGGQARIDEPGYTELFGLDARRAPVAEDLWGWLLERAFAGPTEMEDAVTTILRRGTLAERILAELEPNFGREDLKRVYRELCACLSEGRMFRA